MTETHQREGKELKNVNFITWGIRGGACAVALLAGVVANGAVPVITNISMVPRLTIQNHVGLTNQIQYSTNLSQTNWVVLTNLVVTESQYWYVDVTAPPSPQRFYQVVFPPVLTLTQLITNISRVPRLTIQSPVGITNQIHYSTNLSQTNWVVLTNLAVTEKQYGYVDVTAPPAPQRFYQVVVPSQTTTNITVTLQQLWGTAGRTNSATNLIQRSSIPTPVNTTAAAFDATHSSIWISMSYVPAWSIGTVVYWGSAPYSMRVSAVASDQIQFAEVSGGYFGWSAGMPIVTSFGYSLSNIVTAAASWINPGVGNTVQVSASAVTGSVGDVVWVGGVGANQFQIISISR